MRILICHNEYARFSGEEHAVLTMADVLRTNGHEVKWFRRSSADIGDSVRKKTQALFSGIYSFDSRKQMARILESEAIDVVQVQNIYPFLSASILLECKHRGVPVVMRCPNYRLFCPTGLHLSEGEICGRCLSIGREWNCIIRNCENNLSKSMGYAARNAFARSTGMIIDNVDCFLVLSEFQKQRFIERGIPDEKLAILPNIAPKLERSDNGRTGDLVSFVGRISPEKGILEFIDASKRLPGIAFAVAGSLNMPELLEAKPPNVELMGFLSNGALDDLYERSRLLVFPSKWYEGFPNVIAKAMGHGKAVIGAAIGAIPEIITDGETGVLFQPGDSRDLSEKIETLWKQPDLCREMGKKGLEKARKEYSEEKYYETLLEVYGKCLAENGKCMTLV